MKSERTQLLTRFAAGADAFDAFLPPHTDALIDYRPAEIVDAWTVREHLIHFVDADIHTFTRIRMAIAEPGKTVMLWEELDWFAGLSYSKQDVVASVQIMKNMRAINTAFLAGLSDEQWDKSWIDHPIRGRWGLDSLVLTFVEHVDFHLEYIQRNAKLWRTNSAA